MNLEQIDTSTTAGKAEVMRLAAEGRRVVCRRPGAWGCAWHAAGSAPGWDWSTFDYAIISEPVGSEEVWFVYKGTTPAMGPFGKEHLARERAGAAGSEYTPVRYIRADLAGEKG